MAGIVVCGAGVVGLTAAMLLAADGHDVTVLERDPAPPPAPASAWDDWERRGVGQFRLAHFLLPAFRELMDAELPSLVRALVDGGAARLSPLGPFAAALDPDGRYEVVTGRRPLVEAVVAAAAESTVGVRIRRGVAVAGLVTAAGSSPAGVPRVVGLRTEAGEVVSADLVVDAGGRRSPLVRWLADVGAPAPTVEEEDSGFVYYGRHVRMPEGTEPGSPVNTYVGSVGMLALPADGGITGVAITAAADDAEVRGLVREGPWAAVMRLLPGGEGLAAAEPVSPMVAMTGIEDRWRRFVVDGRPVATGVVSVGDAWAATNPTLGRGISLGARQAVALRQVIRTVGLDPEAVVRRLDEVTQDELTPWYRSTVWHDRHRLEDLRDARVGDPATATSSDDPLWRDYVRFESAFRQDPMVLLPRFLETILLHDRPEQIVADPSVRARLDELGVTDAAADGPTRGEVLAAISG